MISDTEYAACYELEEPQAWKQKDVAKNTANVMSSYALYDNRLVLGFDNLMPGTTYKLYRRESKKKWKLIDTFTGDEYNELNWGYTDNKVKANMRYDYKLYDCNSGKYTKVETYWTPVKHPKKVKQSGNTVTWKKSKGANGYFVYYHKHYSILDGFLQRDEYFCKKVSNKKLSYTLPEGCKVDGVYAYSKHNGGYYLSWAGIYKNANVAKKYVKNGCMKFVLKHKKQFWD